MYDPQSYSYVAAIRTMLQFDGFRREEEGAIHSNGVSVIQLAFSVFFVANFNRKLSIIIMNDNFGRRLNHMTIYFYAYGLTMHTKEHLSH